MNIAAMHCSGGSKNITDTQIVANTQEMKTEDSLTVRCLVSWGNGLLDIKLMCLHNAWTVFIY